MTTATSQDGDSSMTCDSPFSYPTTVALSTYALISLALVAVFLLVPWFLLQRHNKGRRGKKARQDLLRHAVITGGSSGIGLAIAHELCLKHGCRHITLIARKEAGLKAAKDSLEKELLLLGLETKGPSSISIVPVDVSDAKSVQRVADTICSSPAKGGPPSLLFNVAGTSSSGRFVETDPAEFDRLIRINYLGSAHTARAFLPHMLRHRTDADPTSPAPPSTVVFTSSAAGQVGVYGYSAYSPTKFALRGMAECLAMEVGDSAVSIQVAYPPDTDTPGYEAEQVGKPRETHLISEVAGLSKPEDVARVMVESALAPYPKFNVYFGIEGWMLSTLTSGMGPAQSLFDVACQVFLMGLLRFISLFYLYDFRRIVSKCRRDAEEEGKKKKDSAGAGKVAANDVGHEENDTVGDEHGDTIKGEWLCGGAGW